MGQKVAMGGIKRRFHFDSTQLVAIGFIVLIFVGAIILTLPVSSESGRATDFLSALFTSTSASCITGLVVVDTSQHWSMFGEAVILTLIQIGGLGFMTLATLFSLMLKRHISFKERMRVAQSLNLFNFKGVVKITKHIICGTLAFEGAGAVILSARFIPEYGFGSGLWKGVFTSVSSFCNAGFDLMGTVKPFSSMTGYANDIVVNLTIMLLIVIGGLGFIVWEEIFTLHSFKRFSIFSKLAVITTVSLIISGAVLFMLFEFSNPETLGNLPPKGKILASLFQSVSPRTAGFNTVPIEGMRDVTKVIVIILMFIGANSGSTGGGIKISTFSVLIIALFSVVRGKKEVVVFERRIAVETVLRAFALAFLALTLVFCCSFAISAIETDIPYISVLYECVSAFATVGLSGGITPFLSSASQIILIMLMYMGRVGLLTLTYATFIKQTVYKNKLQYPEGRIIIG